MPLSTCGKETLCYVAGGLLGNLWLGSVPQSSMPVLLIMVAIRADIVLVLVLLKEMYAIILTLQAVQ